MLGGVTTMEGGATQLCPAASSRGVVPDGHSAKQAPLKRNRPLTHCVQKLPDDVSRHVPQEDSHSPQSTPATHARVHVDRARHVPASAYALAPHTRGVVVGTGVVATVVVVVVVAVVVSAMVEGGAAMARATASCGNAPNATPG